MYLLFKQNLDKMLIKADWDRQQPSVGLLFV